MNDLLYIDLHKWPWWVLFILRKTILGHFIEVYKIIHGFEHIS